MNFIQQIAVFFCNFVAFRSVCDGRSTVHKNGKFKRASAVSILASYYAEFLHKEVNPKLPMATRSSVQVKGELLPAINYDQYDSPSFCRYASK